MGKITIANIKQLPARNGRCVVQRKYERKVEYTVIDKLLIDFVYLKKIILKGYLHGFFPLDTLNAFIAGKIPKAMTDRIIPTTM